MWGQHDVGEMLCVVVTAGVVWRRALVDFSGLEGALPLSKVVQSVAGVATCGAAGEVG